MDISNLTLKKIVDKINEDLGHDFCNQFRYTRKELSGSGRASSADILFKFVSDDRDWVINEGGGVEIQYHLFFRGNTIGYGLGFNSQYVPFANDMSPVDYIMPFINAFLTLKKRNSNTIQSLEADGFSLIEGEWDNLNKIRINEYYLFGKEIQICNGILPDEDYNRMIEHIKNELFNLYVAIWKQKIHMDKNIEIIVKYIDLLISNHNLILTGAPGTGKTYLAKQIAAQMILGKEYDEKSASDEEKEKMEEQYGFVQFHPSYDYTDFMEGLRPKENNGNISFQRKDGIFMEFCRKALKAKTEKFVFVIDEINRGDLSKIFGELFFSIDPGYRGEKGKVKTQYSNLWEKTDFFFIPENVYIIGTMNDIDRSVESMDFAMRRRFAFKEVRAEDSINMIKSNEKLASDDIYAEIEKRMNNLNKAILDIQGLSTAYQIGAAYFLKLENYLTSDGKVNESSWKNLWDNHLYGLLFEYLRGMPNSEEELKNLERAYNLGQE